MPITQTVPKKPSFANIINRKTKIIPQSDGYNLIIRPKRSGTNASTTRSALTRTADPTSLEKGITRVRPSPNGQLTVQLKSTTDVAALKNKLASDGQFSDSFEMFEPRKRNPRVILYGVDKNLTADEITQVLYVQNPELSALASDYMTFKQSVKPKLHIKTRSPDTFNVVFEVSPQIRSVLTRMGRVRLNWETVRVEDHIIVTRCFNCCCLGHRSKGKNPRDGSTEICGKPLACSQCSGPHKYSSCPVAHDITQARCPVCDTENRRNNDSKIDTKHNSFDNKCPMFVRYLQSEYNRTDYGS